MVTGNIRLLLATDNQVQGIELLTTDNQPNKRRRIVSDSECSDAG